MNDNPLVFIKSEYLTEAKEWIAAYGMNEHDVFGKFARINVEGVSILFIPDADLRTMFKLAFSHALSSRSIKITSI